MSIYVYTHHITLNIYIYIIYNIYIYIYNIYTYILCVIIICIYYDIVVPLYISNVKTLRQSMSRALDRFKHLCVAEQRRLSSAGGELLGVYAAARRQALLLPCHAMPGAMG